MIKTTVGSARAPELRWRQAYQIAEEFLQRWGTGLTAACREDCVAETAVQAVSAWGRLRDKGRYPACVRTIARRERARVARRESHAAVADPEIEGYAVCEEPEPTLAVLGARVEQDALIAALPQVLSRLSALNALLLMSYYEGFSCTELAERHQLSLDSVRARLHRSRQRVRQLFELRATEDYGVRARARLHA